MFLTMQEQIFAIKAVNSVYELVKMEYRQKRVLRRMAASKFCFDGACSVGLFVATVTADMLCGGWLLVMVLY